MVDVTQSLHGLPAARVQGKSPEAMQGILHLQEDMSMDEPQTLQSPSQL